MPELSINIDGENIDIPEAINIPMKLKNPMFFDVGSHSLNFNLPDTIINKQALGHNNRIEKFGNAKIKVNCTISFGIPIFDATIESDSFGSSFGFKCAVYTNIGAFITNLIKPKLSDLVLDGDRIFASENDLYDHFEALTNSEYPDDDCVLFPVRNDSLMDNTPYAVTPPNWTYQNKWVLKDPGPTGEFIRKIGIHGVIVSPFPYFAYVWQKAFLENGFFIKENIFETNDDLRQLVIYNPNDLDSYNRPDHSYNLSKHVPEINISDIIKNIKTYFNITHFVDNNKKSVIIKKNEDILNDIDYIDITDKAEPDFELKNEKTDGYSLKFDVGTDGFWSDNVKDALHSGRLLDEVQSYGLLPTPPNAKNGDIRKVINEDDYYYYDAVDAMWYVFSKAEQNYYIYGGEELKVSTNISYLNNDVNDDFRYDDAVLPIPKDNDWLVPHTKQEGNNYYPKADRIQFSLRLLFWRGIFQGAYNLPMPLGNHDVYNIFKNKLPNANLGLRWDGDYGLFKFSWEKWVYWYMNERKEIKRKINWSLGDIANIKWHKKYRIDRNDYLIKNIDINIHKTKIAVGMTTLVKI